MKVLDLKRFGDLSNEDLVGLARVAENTERFMDMCIAMAALVKQKKELSEDERNLLSVAYKNVIATRRVSWRMLSVDEQKDDKLILAYRDQLEWELFSMCDEVVSLIKDFLLPPFEGTNTEVEVFYKKMIGDYYRYKAEINVKENGSLAKKYYLQAKEVAEKCLSITDSTRLGLILNYSVCCYEILEQTKEACLMAQTAFDDALRKIGSVGEESFKDSNSIAILQLLKENLLLWKGQQQEADEEDGDAVQNKQT